MKIICILGRSGSGKSTLQSALENLGYSRVITYTTRSPRGQEQDGREYHFVSREKFLQLVEQNALMEYAEYSGNLYGSPRPTAPLNVIVVEPNGFESIRNMYPEEAFGVYVMIPDEILTQRITGRQDTSSAEIARRKAWDKDVFADIENKVDLVIDGTVPIEEAVQEIIYATK